MGMGYGANSITVLFDEDIAKLCPKEFKALVKAIEDTNDSTMDSFFQVFDSAGGYEYEFFSEEEFEIIEEKLKKLKEAFAEKYPSLDIDPFYHYEDNGDRYDDFTGGAWEVCGVYEKVPDAVKIEKKLKKPGALNHQLFVTFG